MVPLCKRKNFYYTCMEEFARYIDARIEWKNTCTLPDRSFGRCRRALELETDNQSNKE